MTSFIVISWGVFVFSFLTVCLFPLGENYDRVKRRLVSAQAQAQKTDYLEEELSKPLLDRVVKPWLKALAMQFEKMKPQKSKNQQYDKLRKLVRQAGFRISAEEYAFLRVVVIVGCGLLFGLLGMLLGSGAKATQGALVGVYAGYVGVRFYLKSRISKRQREIGEQLPDVLDLLSVSVEAGLGFEQAMLQVIGHFEGCLIDELTVTYREMSMGRSRRDALTLLAERCDLNEIKTFVGAIIQAEQLGISMKNVLRTQAATMRTNRRNKVEEKAMKISVKILIPMVTFIFPVLFIVLMGPAAVKILQQFGG